MKSFYFLITSLLVAPFGVSRTGTPSRRAPTPSASRVRRPVQSANVSGATIKRLMEDQNWDEALRLLASANDATSRSLRAAIFERMGYSHAALAELVGSYRTRPNVQVLNRAGGLAFLLGETRLIQGLPGGTMGMNLAQAAQALVEGDVSRAKAKLPSPQALLGLPESPLKEKAIVMASAIYNAQGNAKEALEVLGGNFQQTSGVDLSEIRLQRALVLFEIKRYSEALEELTFITRASPTWYRGQTVGAWASFHAEDYNLALGQLMNLQSPFLAGKFNPEKYLLHSVVLFQLCQYDAASRSLKKLKEEYGNMGGAFASLSSSTSNATGFYNQLKNFATGKLKTESSSSDRVWDGVASQPFVADMSNSIEKLRFERKNISERFRSKGLQPIRSLMLRVFDKVEEAYLYKLARYAKVLSDKMKNDVKETLEGALAADLEINTRLRDRLIRAQAPVQKNIDFKKEVQKGYEFWPFQGEFWRDETGGYAFATTDVCEESAR